LRTGYGVLLALFSTSYLFTNERKKDPTDHAMIIEHFRLFCLRLNNLAFGVLLSIVASSPAAAQAQKSPTPAPLSGSIQVETIDHAGHVTTRILLGSGHCAARHDILYG